MKTRSDRPAPPAVVGSPTIADWLRGAAGLLPGDSPVLDAQVLLAHLLGRPRAWLLAHPESELTRLQEERLREWLSRLQAGEPLPYLLGHWEFFGLEFELTPAVLIPRPETELLVEKALEWLKGHPQARLGVDVGTGSGCIAVSLAVNLPELRLVASDRSAAALHVARRNAQKHAVADRIQFVQADMLEALSVVDLILANLPYIPSPTLRQLEVYGREPTLALDGGPDGLRLIRWLLSQAPAHLAPGGLLLLEIEARQGQAAGSLALAAFPRADVALERDLAGRDRVILIKDA